MGVFVPVDKDNQLPASREELVELVHGEVDMFVEPLSGEASVAVRVGIEEGYDEREREVSGSGDRGLEELVGQARVKRKPCPEPDAAEGYVTPMTTDVRNVEPRVEMPMH